VSGQQCAGKAVWKWTPLLGDGSSMGMGPYLSAKSEKEVFVRKRQKAAERIAQTPDEEKESLRHVYQEQGHSEQLITRV